MSKLLLVSILALILIAAGCGSGSPAANSYTNSSSNSGSPGSSSTSASVSTNFMAGVSHINGTYRFTNNNYLLEGAQKISDLGSSSIFIYLTPWFRGEYPDEANTNWPASDPADLQGLAQSGPFDQVFHLPFKTIVMTAFTFANADQVQGIAQAQSRLSAEENEFYQLTKYLYSHFSGSGKTFVLKNWESDGFAAFLGNTTGDIPQNVVDDLTAWLSARQRGVTRARNEAHDSSVLVLNGAEVNRVLDFTQNGLKRVINAVIPQVNADMLTYSSYDAMVYGSDVQSVQQSLGQALQTIEKFAPDPQGMGNRRILISEYGLFENEQPGDTWRADAVLSTAKSAGLYGAFLWNLYDNECKLNGQYAPVATAQGDPQRPTNGDCRGLWIIRPDGTTSSVLDSIKKYF